MGVIFETGDDVNDLLVPFIQGKNGAIRPETIHELYRRASLGEISSASFWGSLGLGGAYPEIETEYLDTCLTLDPNFMAVANELVKTCSLALLSNDVSEWSDYLRAKYDLNRIFGVTVVSGDVGCRKPDRRIYSLLLERMDSNPRDCTFLDDRARNLRTASEMGMRTIRFAREESDECFLADAEIRGLPELSGALARLH